MRYLVKVYGAAGDGAYTEGATTGRAAEGYRNSHAVPTGTVLAVKLPHAHSSGTTWAYYEVLGGGVKRIREGQAIARLAPGTPRTEDGPHDRRDGRYVRTWDSEARAMIRAKR